jgi:2-hydroxychromene-2-carboxylate isomerase
MKRYLPFVIIAAVAALTVGAGAMLYRAKQRTSAVGSPAVAGSTSADEAERLHVRSLRLDGERFARDSTSDEVKARVLSDGEQGVSRGVKNTPTLFINDREVRAFFSPERLHDAIDAALAESTPKAFGVDRASPPAKIQPRGERE